MSLVAEIDRLNREICLPPLLNEIDSLTSLDERLNLTKSAVNIGSEQKKAAEHGDTLSIQIPPDAYEAPHMINPIKIGTLEQDEQPPSPVNIVASLEAPEDKNEPKSQVLPKKSKKKKKKFLGVRLECPSNYVDENKDKQASENLTAIKAPVPAAYESKVAESPASQTVSSVIAPAPQGLSISLLDDMQKELKEVSA